DLATAREVQTLPVDSPSAASNIQFSPEGERLACGCADGVVHVWELKTGKLVSQFGKHDGWALEVTYSGDGKLLAAADLYKGVVKVWDVARGDALYARKVPGKAISGVALAPDSRYVAFLASDGLVRVLDGM